MKQSHPKEKVSPTQNFLTFFSLRKILIFILLLLLGYFYAYPPVA